VKEFDSSHRLVRFEGFQLDLRAGELHSDGGKTFRLPEQPFQILTMLLQRPGEVLTREDIRKKLWPNDTFVEYEHSISAAMNRLRQTLGDSADRPHYIETLARRGYRWMVSVEWVESSPPTSAVLDLPESWKTLVPTTVVIVALLIAGGLYFRSLRATPLTGKDTVVLADFTNTTGDPVFDDTLKQALTVQLQQSPFLNILPEQTVDDTLKLMGRSPGQHLTREVARELCQRAGSRVMLAGSIASLGSQYVIGVNAVNCQTGNTLAQEQVTADSKEHVLKALGETTPELRKKLGETLSTIQKFDTSLEQATTSSLEALKAYTLSRETMNEKSEVAAIPMMKHAIELDPNFALAYAKMGIMYSNIGEATLASQYSQKAYDLRERVSEREKFRITGNYYRVVTGELEKAVQTCELWARNYPRDPNPPGYLGLFHSVMGQYEKSVAEELESNRLVPDSAPNLENLMFAYADLNRFDEAKAIYQEATGRKLDYAGLHVFRYEVAMIEGDAAEMERQVVWGAGKRGVEDVFLSSQSDTEAFSGRLGKAREFSRRAVELARHNQQNGTAAGWQTNQALREAEFGHFGQSRKDAAAALALASDRFTQVLGALALARAGDSAQAQKIADNVAREFPLDTVVHSYWLPTIRASLALNRHEPAKAIELLQPAAPYELGFISVGYIGYGSLYPVYVRGQAYLQLHQGNEAATEFQKFLDHRGIVFNFPLGALAHLGLARAYTLSGDTAKAKTAYQDFLALWKNADPDTPILKDAKAEHAKLM
jgi:eukaryotic-like serine/threonine-protein kinase